jgi:hypothetical protein
MIQIMSVDSIKYEMRVLKRIPDTLRAVSGIPEDGLPVNKWG